MTCKTNSHAPTATREVTQITIYVGLKNKSEPDHPHHDRLGVNP